MDYELIATTFLFIQTIVLGTILIITILGNIYHNYYEKNIEVNRKILEQMIIDVYLGHKELDQIKIKDKTSQELLIMTLEKIDRYIKGEEWDNLKQNIIIKHLINKARSYTNAKRNKRLIAARIFALYSEHNDKEQIMQLLKDDDQQISNIASVAIIKFLNKNGTITILKRMTNEKGFNYIFHRDLLLNSWETVGMWINDIKEKTKQNSVKQVCHDLIKFQSNW